MCGSIGRTLRSWRLWFFSSYETQPLKFPYHLFPSPDFKVRRLKGLNLNSTGSHKGGRLTKKEEKRQRMSMSGTLGGTVGKGRGSSVSVNHPPLPGLHETGVHGRHRGWTLVSLGASTPGPLRDRRRVPGGVKSSLYSSRFSSTTTASVASVAVTVWYSVSPSYFSRVYRRYCIRYQYSQLSRQTPYNIGVRRYRFHCFPGRWRRQDLSSTWPLSRLHLPVESNSISSIVFLEGLSLRNFNRVRLQ